MQRLAGATRATILILLCGLAVPAAAAAGGLGLVDHAPPGHSPWAVTFAPDAGDAGVARAPHPDLSTAGLFADVTAVPAPPERDTASAADGTTGDQTARTTAFVYSDAYQLRRKIHFIASFATIPLFATEWALGQKLYNGTGTSSTRSAHQAVGAGLGVLFGVNTVTGVWNMIEARHDPNGRTKRLVHSLLMLGADAGFLATAAVAPNLEGEGNRSLHRSLALTSVAMASAGYVIMLFGR